MNLKQRADRAYKTHTSERRPDIDDAEKALEFPVHITLAEKGDW